MSKAALVKALIKHFGHREWTLIDGDKVQLDGSEDVVAVSALGIDLLVLQSEGELTSRKRIAELKQLLLDSDYKVLPDYDKPSDEIKAQRQAWRDEIRILETALNGG
jgi:pSer/pThr/pTyr-binding forkhead associated (FHA) protein